MPVFPASLLCAHLQLFKVILGLDGVSYPMSEAEIADTLGVLWNVTARKLTWRYATQQVSGQRLVLCLLQ